MNKLFKYLNLTEADIKLLDPETIEMSQVVDIMQKTYMSAPNSRKKDTLANIIAETIALLLARINSIKGLSKDAKKKVEEENKELPKSAPKPQEAPKEQPKQEQPKKETPKEEPKPKEQPKPKEKENPFKVGQIWMNKTIGYKMKITKIVPESDLLIVDVMDTQGYRDAYYAIELGLEKVEKGDWVLLDEEKREEPPMPEDEVETEEEIKSAISGLSLLAKMGDDEAKMEIKRLKAKLKKK